jgi:hypothetical protein
MLAAHDHLYSRAHGAFGQTWQIIAVDGGSRLEIRDRSGVDQLLRLYGRPRRGKRACASHRYRLDESAGLKTARANDFARRTLTLTDVDRENYESASAGDLVQVEIPGAGKKHGEIVVLTPEQRRAVEDALNGYLQNYEAARRAGEIDDYYLFPGSKMRMLDKTGRRWIRRVRSNAKPLSRDGARVAFQELEEIAKVPHVVGRGWYGLRRIAADMAETRRPTIA